MKGNSAIKYAKLYKAKFFSHKMYDEEDRRPDCRGLLIESDKGMGFIEVAYGRNHSSLAKRISPRDANNVRMTIQHHIYPGNGRADHAGDIVVLHCNANNGKKRTVDQISEEFRREGYKLPNEAAILRYVSQPEIIRLAQVLNDCKGPKDPHIVLEFYPKPEKAELKRNLRRETKTKREEERNERIISLTRKLQNLRA